MEVISTKANVRIVDSAADFLNVETIEMWSGKFIPFSVDRYYNELDDELKKFVEKREIPQVGGKTTEDYVIQVPYIVTVTTDPCAQNNAERTVFTTIGGRTVEIVSAEKVEGHYEMEKGFVRKKNWPNEVKEMTKYFAKAAKGTLTLADVKKMIKLSAILTGKLEPEEAEKRKATK